MPGLPPIDNDIGDDIPACPIFDGAVPYRLRVVVSGLWNALIGDFFPDFEYILEPIAPGHWRQNKVQGLFLNYATFQTNAVWQSQDVTAFVIWNTPSIWQVPYVSEPVCQIENIYPAFYQRSNPPVPIYSDGTATVTAF